MRPYGAKVPEDSFSTCGSCNWQKVRPSATHFQGSVQPQRAAHQSRAANVGGLGVRHDEAQPALSSTDRLVPVSSDVRSSSNRHSASHVQEAYDLQTFLKERDACGVRYSQL